MLNYYEYCIIICFGALAFSKGHEMYQLSGRSCGQNHHHQTSCPCFFVTYAYSFLVCYNSRVVNPKIFPSNEIASGRKWIRNRPTEWDPLSRAKYIWWWQRVTQYPSSSIPRKGTDVTFLAGPMKSMVYTRPYGLNNCCAQQSPRPASATAIWQHYSNGSKAHQKMVAVS